MMALPSLWVNSGEAPAKERFANVHCRKAFLLLTRKSILFWTRVCEDTDVFLRRAGRSDLDNLADLYEAAFKRGEWFGSRSSLSESGDATREHLAQILGADRYIVVLFHDSDDTVLGATALDLSDEEGILIDDSQIDPIKGRRRGIMTNYFRRLVPAVSKYNSFWTEFVLTPNSRVLRRTLITELGMAVTGIRPNAYRSRATGTSYSVLVALGPEDKTLVGLRSSLVKNTVVSALLNALQPETVKKGDIPLERQSFSLTPSESFEEVKIPISDIFKCERQLYSCA
jgi:hypothetical protein